MKKMLKILSLFLTILFICSGCGENSKDVKKIGILQFVEHEALDASRKGFIDALSENGFKDGENIEIDYKNASGDQSNCDMIANGFANEKDLILAIATPSAISAAKHTNKIPILITAITNPQGAELVISNQKPGKNVTGTSDLAPIDKQISLIKEIKSNAKNVGIFYSSGEVNSKYQAEIATKECEKIGLVAKSFTFSHPSEMVQIVSSMKDIDIIYIPTDNVVASNLDLVINAAKDMKIPIIPWDKNSVLSGGTATYGIDYYELGKITAKQAVKILNDKQKPENMPIEYIKNAKLFVNKKTFEELGLKISDKMLKEAEIL